MNQEAGSLQIQNQHQRRLNKTKNPIDLFHNPFSTIPKHHYPIAHFVTECD